MSDRKSHWERVHEAESPTELSWHQASPKLSLNLIRDAAPDPATAIIDIGGGASTLVDALLSEGYRDVTVLDISELALAHSKKRLGIRADEADWIVADITTWWPTRTWDVWHDRAVFHFLTNPIQQDAYVANLARATAPGSMVIISTFALDGPQTCSGLPVQRYSRDSLAARLGHVFELIDEHFERHLTPRGSSQSFIYAVLRRATGKGEHRL